MNVCTCVHVIYFSRAPSFIAMNLFQLEQCVLVFVGRNPPLEVFAHQHEQVVCGDLQLA